MFVQVPRPWATNPPEVTPEAVWHRRRALLRALGSLGGAALASPRAVAHEETGGYPASRNPRYTLDRPITDEAVAARFNIFDEFAGAKDEVWEASAGFRTHPWRIHIGGQVRRQRTLDTSDLARLFQSEERLYRHRCVETWAMAVPWTGFPLARLVELAEPLAKARFVRFVSAARPEQMPGWYATRRLFPYYEALSLGEATNELAFVATGIYGHPLPPQHGAPVRLVVPWKYGFKSAKSIVGIAFTAERPATFWSDLSPDRYDFLANVDPTSTQPWPQSQETMLGTEERRETLPFNGYADLVAGLYP
jgi:methionine sulfoxide reductase catalytic subunit